MRRDNSERITWCLGAAAVLSLLLCCAMPLIVATFGLAAITATVKYGLAGLAVVGLLVAGLYLLRAASRKNRWSESRPAPADAVSLALRVRPPNSDSAHLEDPPAGPPRKFT